MVNSLGLKKDQCKQHNNEGIPRFEVMLLIDLDVGVFMFMEESNSRNTITLAHILYYNDVFYSLFKLFLVLSLCHARELLLSLFLSVRVISPTLTTFIPSFLAKPHPLKKDPIQELICKQEKIMTMFLTP